jgi:hypothetical protein
MTSADDLSAVSSEELTLHIGAVLAERKLGVRTIQPGDWGAVSSAKLDGYLAEIRRRLEAYDRAVAAGHLSR